MLKVTIVVDNRICDGVGQCQSQSQSQDLLCEHGLSLFVECEGLRILCDMGASEIFASNGAQLGIDLAQVDFALLSHAHADHTGGLRYFLEHSEAPIYLSDRVFGHNYYSTRHVSKRDISCDEFLFAPYIHRYRMVSKSCQIIPNISLVHCNVDRYSRPHANSHLRVEPHGEQEREDDFAHEISLAIATREGLVIISPCSHNGAANIITSCQEFTGVERVVAFIGGLHFVDGEYSRGEVSDFADALSSLAPSTIFYTGHCTGALSLQLLQELLPGRVRAFHTGLVIDF